MCPTMTGWRATSPHAGPAFTSRAWHRALVPSRHGACLPRCSSVHTFQSPGSPVWGSEGQPGPGCTTRMLTSIGMSRREAQRMEALYPAQDQTEAILTLLADGPRVPVRVLPEVLLACPDILALTPKALEEQIDWLRGIWTTGHGLSTAVQVAPDLLLPSFPEVWAARQAALEPLGFNPAQAEAMLRACPTLFTAPADEDAVRDALLGAGVPEGDLGSLPPAFLAALSRSPACLQAQGAMALRAQLARLAAWGVPHAAAREVLGACPALLSTPPATLAAAVAALERAGLGGPALARVIAGWPAVLRANPNTINLTLSLLRFCAVPLAKVVESPIVFKPDPMATTGPRLSYLATCNPQGLERYKLSSIVTTSDEEFARRRTSQPVDEYRVFKERWLRLTWQKLMERAGKGDAQVPPDGESLARAIRRQLLALPQKAEEPREAP
ncbi:hypothetical protein ACKKBF_B18945 [Auxenochlorella protothecoides x Auxenochlorella symbiontica]